MGAHFPDEEVTLRLVFTAGSRFLRRQTFRLVERGVRWAKHSWLVLSCRKFAVLSFLRLTGKVSKRVSSMPEISDH